MPPPLPLIPSRTHTRMRDGTWRVTVTPPRETGFKPSTIDLTEDQFRRYTFWLDGDAMIQQALPELSADQREVLLSGINSVEWDKAFKEDE